MKNSFFVEYEFDTKSCEVFGQFRGNKLYSIQYSSVWEECIEDIIKVLKTRKNCAITFQCFTGYETIDLLRIVQDYTGKTYTSVYWYRNNNGIVTGKDIKENCSINKANIKNEFEHALTAFFEHEDEKYYIL